jgi:hypothetical protein
MIALTVPSGKSPGWFGIVVRSLVFGLRQISWLPFCLPIKDKTGAA